MKKKSSRLRVELYGHGVTILLNSEKLTVRVIVGQGLRELIGERVRFGFCRQRVNELKYLFPIKKVTGLRVVKVDSSAPYVTLKASNQVLHCDSLGIGTKAPRTRIFLIKRGADTMGA
jgi:hypothetical protein